MNNNLNLQKFQRGDTQYHAQEYAGTFQQGKGYL